MIGQHAIVAPPVTTPPQHIAHPGSAGAVARLPIGLEHLSSSSHPNSALALVRPVPQQASPVRVSTVAPFLLSAAHCWWIFCCGLSSYHNYFHMP